MMKKPFLHDYLRRWGSTLLHTFIIIQNRFFDLLTGLAVKKGSIIEKCIDLMRQKTCTYLYLPKQRPFRKTSIFLVLLYKENLRKRCAIYKLVCFCALFRTLSGACFCGAWERNILSLPEHLMMM